MSTGGMVEGDGSAGTRRERARPVLSLVLCSRNDAFQGNSLWRLETTLNHAARQAAALGRLDDVEIIVSDWGSERPLRDAVRILPEAARITRFLTIPPALAIEKQRDSRFAEVIAINAAARRARGEYIGRIDQDTLVGRRFFEWLFAAADGAPGPFPVEASVMISNRRRIPYDFAARCLPYPLVERYVASVGRHLPLMGGSGSRFWEVYIGILLFHRRLWEECGGYDERMIYYSYMEFDLFLRLCMRYQGVDLGPVVGEAFYHLDHIPAWLSWNQQPRSNNNIIRTPEDPPPEFSPNGPDWGLRDHELALDDTPEGGVAEPARWRSSYWPRLAGASASSAVTTLGRLFGEQMDQRGRMRGVAYTTLVSTGVLPRLRRLRARLA